MAIFYIFFYIKLLSFYFGIQKHHKSFLKVINMTCASLNFLSSRVAFKSHLHMCIFQFVMVHFITRHMITSDVWQPTLFMYCIVFIYLVNCFCNLVLIEEKRLSKKKKTYECTDVQSFEKQTLT